MTIITYCFSLFYTENRNILLAFFGFRFRDLYSKISSFQNYEYNLWSGWYLLKNYNVHLSVIKYNFSIIFSGAPKSSLSYCNLPFSIICTPTSQILPLLSYHCWYLELKNIRSFPDFDYGKIYVNFAQRHFLLKNPSPSFDFGNILSQHAHDLLLTMITWTSPFH